MISVETFLVDAVTSRWNEVVIGVPFTWGSAALALQFMPRLAMREAIDDGSDLTSHYAIGFVTPAGWHGTVTPSNGGWLVATTTDAVSLPKEMTAIAGTPGTPNTPATALTLAIRSAASAQWDAHGRTPDQLVNCALGALFDTRPDASGRRATWRRPVGDVGVAEAAAVIESGVWRGTSGITPSYADLSGLTLRALFARTRGEAGADRALEQVRAALRRELVRRHLVDPAAIEGSGLREGELGPRFDDLYVTIEGFGTRLFGLELFRLLELGLVSLDRRVAAEETLPALVEREWTEPVLTGFYDSVDRVPTIPIDELTAETDAHSWFSTVAAGAAVVSVNQAGDHLAGFWHERRFDPAAGPVRLVEWAFGGNRDRAAGGLVYDFVWVAGEETVTGTYSFSEVDGGVEAVADWGETMTFRRRVQSNAVFAPGEQTADEPATDMVRPHWNDAEIDALPVALRERVRAAERSSLHPSEVTLLAAIAGRIAADLEAITASWVDSTDERQAMCEHLAIAFGYFRRNGASSPHIAAARQYVLAALMAMEGDGSPLDVILDEPAPQSYLHALAKRHAEMACPAITDCLGMPRQQLAWFAAGRRRRRARRAGEPRLGRRARLRSGRWPAPPAHGRVAGERRRRAR